jgi:F-type H+-transporting ATPase subunit epsilon
MKAFKLHFLCADHCEYEGDCVSINLPLVDGYAGILADHANMVSIIKTGELRIDTGSEVLEYAITDGLLQIENGAVLILAFSAEKPDEIDEKRAEEAAERARLKLRRQQSRLEYRQAQAALSRALNRLKVKHRG